MVVDVYSKVLALLQLWRQLARLIIMESIVNGIQIYVDIKNARISQVQLMQLVIRSNLIVQLG